VLELYLLSQMKAAASAFMREVLLRILLILLIVFYYFGWINLHQFVVTTILVHIAPLLGLAFIAAKTPNFGLALSRDAFSGAEIKKLLSFAWYHLLSSITSYLMGYLDMLILASQSVKGLADAQIYSVAIFLVSFLVLPYRSMINAATPKINEAYHNNDMSLMKNLFIRSSDNMLIGVLAMWLLILPNMHNAEALLKADYKGITAIVLILSIGRVTDVITGPNSELIGLSKHYKFLFRSTLLLVVAIVVLDRLFIPRYGIYAAAWVTTLCTMIYNIAKMVFLYVKMKIQPFNKATAGILLSAGLACVPAYFLPTAVNAFLDTFYRTAITLPVYVAALYLLKASPDLNTYIASIRKNKRLF
jgi:O-antigen/teichoic acid export membrane protein